LIPQAPKTMVDVRLTVEKATVEPLVGHLTREFGGVWLATA
jgi:hypothetical protein